MNDGSHQLHGECKPRIDRSALHCPYKPNVSHRHYNSSGEESNPGNETPSSESALPLSLLTTNV